MVKMPYKDLYDEQASGDPIVLHRTMNKGPGNLFTKKVWRAQVHYTTKNDCLFSKTTNSTHIPQHIS